MLKHALVLTTLVLASCGQFESTNNSVASTTQQEAVSINENRIHNALNFINGYVENSNEMNQSIGVLEWVNSNSLTTDSFKTELKKLINEAYRQDPELGLGTDPIFDAQDNPSEGFELASFDENINYLTVKGKNWPEFKLTMKIVEVNGNWLVDGCGMVNIPNDKRAER